MRARNVCLRNWPGDAGAAAVLVDLKGAGFDVLVNHRATATLQLAEFINRDESVIEAVGERDGPGSNIRHFINSYSRGKVRTGANVTDFARVVCASFYPAKFSERPLGQSAVSKRHCRERWRLRPAIFLR